MFIAAILSFLPPLESLRPRSNYEPICACSKVLFFSLPYCNILSQGCPAASAAESLFRGSTTRSASIKSPASGVNFFSYLRSTLKGASQTFRANCSLLFTSFPKGSFPVKSKCSITPSDQLSDLLKRSRPPSLGWSSPPPS